MEARPTFVGLSLAVALATILALFVGCGTGKQTGSPSPTPEPTTSATAGPTPASATEELADVPSGSLLFFSAYGYSPNLYSINADGSGIKQLTDSPEFDRTVGFSPDGKLLAYSSGNRDDGQPDGLYVMSSDGSNSHLVASDQGPRDPGADPRWAEFVSWSSRGRILYAQAAHQVYADYWTANPDGSDAVRISQNNACRAPVWSPDGEELSLCQCTFDLKAPLAPSTCSLSIVDQHGGLIRTLVEDLTAILTSPIWSPDGNELLYLSQNEGANSFSLVVMNADGTNVRPLYESVGSEPHIRATWSPDGSQIALINSDGVQAHPSQIVMISPSDGSSRVVTTVEDFYDSAWSPDGSRMAVETAHEIKVISPADGSDRTVASATVMYSFGWSPTGNKIAYTSMELQGSEPTLSVVDVDGGEPKELAFPVDNSGTAWSPDGKQVIFASSVERRAGVWWIAPDGSERGRLDQLSKEKAPPDQPTVDGVIGGCKKGAEDFSCVSPDGKSEAIALPKNNLLRIEDLASGATMDIEINGAQVSNASPVWSNDGTRIAVYSDEGNLYIVDVATGEARSVAEAAGPGEYNPSIAWSTDDAYIYYVKGTVCMYGCTPGLLYRVKADGADEERIADIRVDSIYGFKP